MFEGTTKNFERTGVWSALSEHSYEGIGSNYQGRCSKVRQKNVCLFLLKNKKYKLKKIQAGGGRVGKKMG